MARQLCMLALGLGLGLVAPASASAYVPAGESGGTTRATPPEKNRRAKHAPPARRRPSPPPRRVATPSPRRPYGRPRRTSRPAPRPSPRRRPRQRPAPAAPPPVVIQPQTGQPARSRPAGPSRKRGAGGRRPKPSRRSGGRSAGGRAEAPRGRRSRTGVHPQSRDQRLERAAGYLDARTALAALPFGLGAPIGAILEVATNEEVKRDAERVARQRERREARRSKALTYLRGIDAARDSDGKTRAIATALGAGSDPKVRDLARRIELRRRERRVERRRERLERVRDRVFAPDGGPELDDYRSPVGLPFPGGFGSVELGCTRQVHPTAAFSCLGSGDAKRQPRSAGVETTLTGTTSRGETELSSDGRGLQTLGLTTDMRVTGAAGATRGRLGAELEAFVGRETSYTANLSPDRAEAVSEGDVDPPNPVDPRSLEPGESLELSRESYLGTGQTASYRLLQVQLGHTDGRRVSSGVQRLGEERVRIYVGDEDVVENALAIGFGTDDVGAAIGLSSEFSDGRLRTVDLDISSRAGWQRYQLFVSTGRLPRGPGDGLVGASIADTARWSGDRTLEARLGPVTLGGTWEPFDGEVTETLHMSGKRERTVSYRDGDVTTVRSLVRRGPRRGWRPGRLALLLRDADGPTVEGLLEHRGRSADLGERQSVMLDFTPGELAWIRRNAVEQLAELSSHGDQPLSADEVDALMRGNPDAYVPGIVGGGDTYFRALARADGASEILTALTHGALRSSNVVAVELLELEHLDGEAPGRIVVLDD